MQNGSFWLGALGLGLTVLGISSYYNQIANFVNTALNSSGANGFLQGPNPVPMPEPSIAGTALVGIGALMVLGLRKKRD